MRLKQHVDWGSGSVNGVAGGGGASLSEMVLSSDRQWRRHRFAETGPPLTRMSLVGEIQMRKKKTIHSQPIEIMDALRKKTYTLLKGCS